MHCVPVGEFLIRGCAAVAAAVLTAGIVLAVYFAVVAFSR
jgi:hypothetical protein